MPRLSLVLIAVIGIGLAACGETATERGLTGAGIGAAGGAATGAATGGDPGTGAILGGLAGGAAGALTEEEDIDLGEPLWED